MENELSVPAKQETEELLRTSTKKRVIRLVKDGEGKKLKLYFSTRPSLEFRRQLRENNFSFRRVYEYWHSELTAGQEKKVRRIIEKISKEDKVEQ